MIKKKEREYLNEEGVRRIFSRMEELGIKRVELSRALGFANGSYVTRIEQGSLKINLNTLGKWAAALQTTKEYLLQKTDDPNDLDYVDVTSEAVRKLLVIYKSMNDKQVKLWTEIGQNIVSSRLK